MSRRFTPRFLAAGTAIIMLLPLQSVMAASGDVLSSNDVTTDAGSANSLSIVQNSGSGATQGAGEDGSAATNVTSNQTQSPDISVSFTQDCGTDSGALCIQDGSPTIGVVATQNITASSANLLAITQKAISGLQSAAVTGSALTTMQAVQTVAPSIVLNIAQDCSKTVGACVQGALPVISTIANQIITATASNDASVTQSMSSGSVQNADIALNAVTQVSATQVVTPSAVVSLVQTCKVDTGLCIQAALPLIQTLVQQVVNAHATNTAILSQSGATDQNADVQSSGGTLVSTSQTVHPLSGFSTDQFCDVHKGLCIQERTGLQPLYFFSDGQSTESGTYAGTLDTHALDNGLTRTSVQTVAMGMCPSGQGMCPQVQQLLFWMFGPEPTATPAAITSNTSAASADDNTSSRRGHQTNVIGSIIHFLQDSMNSIDTAPAAFGGSGNTQLSSQTLSLICAVQKGMPANSTDSSWQWAASQIASQENVSASLIAKSIQDTSLCPSQTASDAVHPATSLIAFPVNDSGPVSSNQLWNDCIRGKSIPLSEVRSNPDLDGNGLSKTCSDYHQDEVWYQPDLGMYFTWDNSTQTLKLPDGYIAVDN